MSSSFTTLAKDVSALVTESKADRIAELLLAGTMTKAQIAKEVGANYSQVHGKEKELLNAGRLSAPAPLGKKGKPSISATAPKNKQSSRVVKQVAKTQARPAGTPTAASTPKKTPNETKIDEIILHMAAVIEDATAVDLISATEDAVPHTIKDTMTSPDLNAMIRERLKHLLKTQELFQNSTGVFSLTQQGEITDDDMSDDDTDEDIAAFRDDGDDTTDWIQGQAANSRRTGGYHL